MGLGTGAITFLALRNDWYGFVKKVKYEIMPKDRSVKTCDRKRIFFFFCKMIFSRNKNT